MPQPGNRQGHPAECLEITAWTRNDDGSIEEIMGVRHKTLPIEGVQFHESIMTEQGRTAAQLQGTLTRGRRPMDVKQALSTYLNLDLSGTR